MKPNTLITTAILAAFTTGNAFAQVRPDAGTLLPQPPSNPLDEEATRNSVRPTISKPETAPAAETSGQQQGSLAVKGFQFESDAQGVSSQELQQLLADRVGKTQSLPQLQNAAAQVEAWLRTTKGLLQAKAWVPIQKVSDGVVQIKVVQGTIANVRVDATLAGTRRGEGMLAIANARLHTGDPLTQATLEETVYRVMDYAQGLVRIVLVPSAAFGQYDVLLEPIKRDRISGSISVDNTGNRYTSQWHDSDYLVIDDVTGRSDQLQFYGQLLTPNQQALKARYQLPLLSGWTVGADAQRTQYKLCCEFSGLDAKGDTTTYSADATYNWVRTRALSSMINVAVQHRELANEQLGVTLSERSLDSATLKGTLWWSGQADHSAVIALTAGRADLSANAGDKAADAVTTQVAGNYQKLALTYLQNRPLWGSTALRLSFTGQLASKNLDSSEKLSLGGLSGVRAYPNGEGLGDQGAVAQMEIIFHHDAQWQFGPFVDYGWIKCNAKAWDGMSEPNTYHIQGAGFGVTWQPLPNFSLQAIAAARMGKNPGANEVTGAASDGRSSRSRGWLVATWNF